MIVAKNGGAPLLHQYVLGCFNAIHLVKFIFRQIASVDACVVLDEVFKDGLALLEFFV